MNVYCAVSTAVGTRGPVGACASFCVEMYRRAGVWFIDRVNEANEFFRKILCVFIKVLDFINFVKQVFSIKENTCCLINCF